MLCVAVRLTLSLCVNNSIFGKTNFSVLLMYNFSKLKIATANL